MIKNRRLLIPVAAVALIGGVAAGCSGSGGDSGVAANPNGTAAPLQLPQSQAQEQAQTTQSPSLQVLGDPYELIPELVEKVQPSVVSVQVQSGQGGGEGSGVVWDGDRGLIVTNNHVVEGAQAVQVVLNDGESMDAQVLGTDPVSDLAVIKVSRTDLPSATFAEELPRVGELAIAMGNPLGFENSVTAGIVSALHRSLGEEPFIDLIQTDAPISPGNSGGALVNRDGEVMGINSAGIPSTENANSLGFAIPAPTVISIVNQLLESGTASHAYLGISSSDTEEGVVIESVGTGSAAEAAGLQPGDVIVAFDGQEVTATDDLVSALRSKAAGDTATLTIERNGERSDVTVTLGERPTEPAA
jgi:S1-C subfamily serine protease